MPDNILIQYALAGDCDAFEVLVKRYTPLLVKYIARLTPDKHQVADILQYVLLQLYLSLPTLYTEQAVKAWLMRVAHNRCIDERRRRQLLHFSQLETEYPEEDISFISILPDTAPLPEELAEQHEEQRRILSAISLLPPKQRLVVWLRYTRQWSYAEIGQRLNIPETTAKTCFSRAKPLLRQLLAREDQE